MRISKRTMRWACAAALVAGVGYGVYFWLASGRTSDTYSNDVGSVLVSADGLTLFATAPGQQRGDRQDNC